MKITLTEKQKDSLKFKISLQPQHRLLDVRLGKKLLAAGMATFVKAGEPDAFGNYWRVDEYMINDDHVALILAQFPELDEEEEKIVINFIG